MHSLHRVFHCFLVAMSLVALSGDSAFATASNTESGVSILLYHRFGQVAADSMTVTTNVFGKQLEWLREHRYEIIPLRTLVDAIKGNRMPNIGHAVVVTVDDGHRSVYTDLFPLVQRYRFPVTLFIYPSAISNASYALTWEQLAEMTRSGLIDVQSHSYWHPNFRREKARLNPAQYNEFVVTQLQRSRSVIAKHVGNRVDMLAWPFGIYDPDLEKTAERVGFVAAFSIERRPALPNADLLSLPRYIMTDQDRGARFAAIAAGVAR